MPEKRTNVQPGCMALLIGSLRRRFELAATALDPLRVYSHNGGGAGAHETSDEIELRSACHWSGLNYFNCHRNQRKIPTDAVTAPPDPGKRSTQSTEVIDMMPLL